MLARLLRNKIEIHKPIETKNNYGAVNESFDLYYSTKAAILNQKGGESELKRDEKEITFLVRNRKDKNLDTSMRIIFNDNTYNIVEILPNYDGIQGKELQIRAKKID